MWEHNTAESVIGGIVKRLGEQCIESIGIGVVSGYIIVGIEITVLVVYSIAIVAVIPELQMSIMSRVVVRYRASDSPLRDQIGSGGMMQEQNIGEAIGIGLGSHAGYQKTQNSKYY